MGRLEAQLHELQVLSAGSEPDRLRRRVHTILRGRSGVLIAAAARIVQHRRWTDLRSALVTAFDILCEDGALRDPGCGGKTACLTTLDHLDHLELEVFVRGARMVQPEKAWGPPVDTAAPVRARAALALARFPGPSASMMLGALLADPTEAVRRAAIEACVGRPDAAGMLAARWALMDPEALVAQLECGVALVHAGGEIGLDLVGAGLSHSDETLREVAALALAESRSGDALQRLGAALEDAVLPHARSLLIRAIVAHRSPAATVLLDDLLEEGSDADARVVFEARLELVQDPRERALLLDRAAARGIRPGR